MILFSVSSIIAKSHQSLRDAAGQPAFFFQGKTLASAPSLPRKRESGKTLKYRIPAGVYPGLDPGRE
jgi:hypothetical protein